MNRKSIMVLAIVLNATGLGLGLLWWFIGWKMGAFAALAASGRVAFIVGIGVIQLLGWAAAVLLISHSMRADFGPPYLIMLGVNGGVLFGNVIWYLTPILGAPLILLMAALALVSVYRWRKRSIPA